MSKCESAWAENKSTKFWHWCHCNDIIPSQNLLLRTHICNLVETQILHGIYQRTCSQVARIELELLIVVAAVLGRRATKVCSISSNSTSYIRATWMAWLLILDTWRTHRPKAMYKALPLPSPQTGRMCSPLPSGFGVDCPSNFICAQCQGTALPWVRRTPQRPVHYIWGMNPGLAKEFWLINYLEHDWQPQ